MTKFTSFLIGFLFSLGLGIAGMLQPAKIISFLDIFGSWDPSLLFVMIGAIGIHAPLYYLIRKRKSPIFSIQWHVPNSKEITPQLIIGSILFGIGWGLAGYCPGPALVSLGSFQSNALIFVSTMIITMILYQKVEKNLAKQK